MKRLEGLRFRDERGLPAVDGHGDSLRSTSDAELRVDVVEVFAHRPGRDEEHGCDFTIRHARGNEAEDFALASAEKLSRGRSLK